MRELKHPYLCISRSGLSYRGSQTWCVSKTVHRSGCGLIAGTDLLLYLHRNHPACSSPLTCACEGEEPLSFAQYHRLVQEIRKKYLPVIPHFGMNGWMLTGGLNRYFRNHHIPLRARWGVWGSELWEAVEELLERDIPVILAVGPNFPRIWGRDKLRFYVRRPDGTYCSTCAVKAHFVTITGMDRRWLQIASWGKRYCIDREEFVRYVKKHSCYLFSNIAYIKELHQNQYRKLEKT